MKTRYFAIIVVVLILSLMGIGFLLYGFLDEKSSLKKMTVQRNLWKSFAGKCYSAKPQTSIIYVSVEGEDTTVYHPKPKPTNNEPPQQISQAGNTPIKDSAKAEIYQQRVFTKDFEADIEISSFGKIDWLKIPWYKVYQKQTTTTYPPVYDSISYPVLKDRILWGAYGGVAVNSIEEFPALKAGLFVLFKTKVGIRAGAMYLPQVNQPWFVDAEIMIPFNKAAKK